MQESKPNPGQTSFWCGVLTAAKQAETPSRARTVRGPYTASSLANSQRDKTDLLNSEGTPHGEGPQKG